LAKYLLANWTAVCATIWAGGRVEEVRG